jgi:hypothetical protein
MACVIGVYLSGIRGLDSNGINVDGKCWTTLSVLQEEITVPELGRGISCPERSGPCNSENSTKYIVKGGLLFEQFQSATSQRARSFPTNYSCSKPTTSFLRANNVYIQSTIHFSRIQLH